MSPLAGRLARTAAGLAGLAAFQPLLCLWGWGYEVACGLFLVEIYALVILVGAGALQFAIGLGRWSLSKDPAARRKGLSLMRTGPILACAGLALFLGGYFAVNLGAL